MSCTVSALSTVADHEGLRRALERLPTLPLRHGFGLTTEVAASAAATHLAGLAARGPDEGRVLVAESGGEVFAGLGLARQTFESMIYGQTMARTGFCFAHGPEGAGADQAAEALIDAALEVCRSWGARHWSLLVAVDDDPLTRAAIRRGWLLADSTLTFTWDVARPETRTGSCGPEVRVRSSCSEDRQVLADMARRTYTSSIRTRYGADPRLPMERTGELYSEWAARACDGSFADEVAVSEVEGRITGFDMIKLDPELSAATGVGFGAKGIAAVLPEARGLKIASCQEAWLNRWQLAQGGRFNSGRVLINNIPMQRAMAKIGGVVTAAHHTFHAWLEDGEGREDR